MYDEDAPKIITIQDVEHMDSSDQLLTLINYGFSCLNLVGVNESEVVSVPGVIPRLVQNEL